MYQKLNFLNFQLTNLLLFKMNSTNFIPNSTYIFSYENKPRRVVVCEKQTYSTLLTAIENGKIKHFRTNKIVEPVHLGCSLPEDYKYKNEIDEFNSEVDKVALDEAGIGRVISFNYNNKIVIYNRYDDASRKW